MATPHDIFKELDVVEEAHFAPYHFKKGKFGKFSRDDIDLFSTKKRARVLDGFDVFGSKKSL